MFKYILKPKHLLILLISLVVIVSISSLIILNHYTNLQNNWKSLNLGYKYLNEENYEEAVIIFEKQIKVDKKNEKLRISYSKALDQTGQFSKAENNLNKGLQVNSKSIEIFLALEEVYVNNNEYDKAIEILETGVKNTKSKKLIDRLDVLKNSPEPPKTNISSKKYFENQVITLSSANNNEIYYTLDNTTPDKNSNKYVEPFEIEEGHTTLKAITIQDDVTSVVYTNHYNIVYTSSSSTNTGNNANGGFVSTNGNDIYYSFQNIFSDELKSLNNNLVDIQKTDIDYTINDSMSLIKLDNGKIRKTLSSGLTKYINIVGDSIYFLNIFDKCIYKVKSNGTDLKKITNDKANIMFIENGYIYFSNENDDGKIYKMTLNGNKKEKLSDISLFDKDNFENSENKKNADPFYSKCLYSKNGWVYFLNPTNKTIYKVSTHGGKESEILSDISYFILSGNDICFVKSGKIGLCDTNGKKEKTTKFSVSKNLITSDDNSFYFVDNKGFLEKVEKKSLTQTTLYNKNLLSDDSLVDIISICGEWVYFSDNQNKKIKKVDINKKEIFDITNEYFVNSLSKKEALSLYKELVNEGTVKIMDGFEEAISITEVAMGSFTKARSDEAVVSIAARRSGSLWFGSVWLYKKVNNKWTIVKEVCYDLGFDIRVIDLNNDGIDEFTSKLYVYGGSVNYCIVSAKTPENTNIFEKKGLVYPSKEEWNDHEFEFQDQDMDGNMELHDIVTHIKFDAGVKTTINTKKIIYTLTNGIYTEENLVEKNETIAKKSNLMKTPTTTSPKNKTKTTQISNDIFKTMSFNEKKDLNIFFSNFSEVFFHDYDSSNYKDSDLINFAILHNIANFQEKITFTYDNSNHESTAYIDANYIGINIKRFFDFSVKHQSTEYYNFSNNKYSWCHGVGDQYLDFAQVTNFTDEGNGTLFAKIIVFTNNMVHIGNSIIYEPMNDPLNNTKFDKLGNATATVKKAFLNEKNTYQLLKYHFEKN